MENSCLRCGKKFKVYKSTSGTKYCSKECYYAHSKETERFKGKNNSNYGVKWGEERRKNCSVGRKLVWDKNENGYRDKVSRKGKSVSAQGRKNISIAQQNRIIRPKLTEEQKIQIGIRSKEKWTIEFKKNHRQIKEKLGLVIPLDKLSDYKFYFKLSDWNSKMFDIITKEEEISLLKAYGVFSSLKNPNGVVRDHKYSRLNGLENEVFPELLRHPVNCEIVQHRTNVSKKSKNSISLEKLINDIINYELPWHEQDKCIELIHKFNNNIKYNRKEYEQLF